MKNTTVNFYWGDPIINYNLVMNTFDYNDYYVAIAMTEVGGYVYVTKYNISQRDLSWTI